MADQFRRDQHQAMIFEAKEHLGKVNSAFRGGLVRYLDLGHPPGGFLCAVLDNDLSRAVGLAEKVDDLPALVSFVHTYFPACAWGSREKRLAWQERIAELMTERDTLPEFTAEAPLLAATDPLPDDIQFGCAPSAGAIGV